MVTAIILAAGLSKRMEGKNKLLLPFAGDSVLAVVVKNIINSGIEEIIAVTGCDDRQVQNVLKCFPVTIIFNKDFIKGMTTSIQKGVSIAKGDGYMICLSDMPFITSGEYSALKNSFEKQRESNKECICVPQYENKKGNPIIFSSFYKEKILSHTNMEGCKEILISNKKNVHVVEMKSNNILKDIDTPDDYNQAPANA